MNIFVIITKRNSHPESKTLSEWNTHAVGAFVEKTLSDPNNTAIYLQRND